MTRERLILKMQQEYANRREENLRRYEQRVEDACRRCDGLKALLDGRRAALMGGLRGALYPARRDERANAGLTDTFQVYNAQIATKLAACGLPADTLAPVYDCPLCRDEGVVYDPTRRLCTCFETELNRRILDELGLLPEMTFERFNERLFSDTPVVGRLSQRVMMKQNRVVCEQYADAYPETGVRDLLLTGKSGLGKTFLLQAIAHRVAERGMSVTYLSAYRLLETMRKAYFENNSDILQPLMDAPLLLVDDLGTEPLMENITVTQLFNLLNERQNAGRHTILSTNLNLEELRLRYTERIVSRLLDETHCRVIKFIGEDVRERLGKVAGGEDGGPA